LSISFGVACGSASGDTDPSADNDGGSSDDDGGFNLGDGSTADDVTLSIDPKSAVLDVDDGVPASKTFSLIATHADGSTESVSDAAWSISEPALGAIAKGTFTASAKLGGNLSVRATWHGKMIDAKLTVKLHVHGDDMSLDDADKGLLKKATDADGSVKWAYPYDDTVFPRGLAGPTLMWNGGLPADGYRIHLDSPTFEYEGFRKVAPPARVDLPAKVWDAFVESTAGAATLEVSRLSALKATKVTTLHWKVAPGSMRGTIYYWSNRQGRVLRIKPGALEPDDFSATKLPPTTEIVNAAGTPSTTACTMTCHSVSADGSTLISGGYGFGGAWDLKSNAPRHGIASNLDSARSSWGFAAVSPDGKIAVPQGAGGAFATADGTHQDGSGLDGTGVWFPSFAPNASALFYVDLTGGPTNKSLFTIPFDPATAKFGAKSLLVDSAAVADRTWIAYPSATPDGKWVVYQRGSVNQDTRGQCLPGEPSCRYDNASDLYLASATAKGAETALVKLNGSAYPFAAGARDKSWNYEPTFAPVAAGGYYWVVFTSRRTYGNMYQGDLATPAQVKQLWVAAIDPAAPPGTDPSHSAFRLPGQALTFNDGSTTQNALNMRGFWALEPCKTDLGECSAGSDCCGGFCDKKEGSATGTCQSAPPVCSADGDKCKTDADCCGKADGARCLGGFCSQKPPA
ncbi:MAG: hypothetical protein ACXWP4_05495, partial [Polyangiales bacterium]